ncbi:MAG: sulfotransferase [Desulfobacterales bacterium]|nr:sulfotransferase [Desulfobacterales bacterium]
MSINKHPNYPDFLCIGLQKAATSWLYDQLRTHRDVWMPPVKELHFFDGAFNFIATRNKFGHLVKNIIKGELYDIDDLSFFRKAMLTAKADEQKEKRKRHLSLRSQNVNHLGLDNHKIERYEYQAKKVEIDWYLSLFEGASRSVTGDVTPAYSILSEQYVQRIAKLIPETSIILIVRNPIDRVWSQLRMRLRHGSISRDQLCSESYIRKVLIEDPIPNIIMRSYPSVIYQRWAMAFGESKIGFFFFDEISQSPEKVRRDICAFLKISGDPKFFSINADYDKKANVEKLEMPLSIRIFLSDFFKKEIDNCKSLFGGPAKGWD